MNFHKTIGFLATLLLVLGLGVPDSYAQDLESVVISLNGTAGTDDGTPAVTFADNIGTTVVTVSVTATYDGGKEAGDTEVVMVDVKAMGTTAEAADYASQPAFPLSITATVGATLTEATGSATIILTPVADDDTDNELVVLEATAGDQKDEAILLLTDSELSIDTITLTLNGVSDGTGAASIADNAGPTVVTVSVSVDFEETGGLPTGETRTVMVGVKTGDETTAEAGDYSSVPSLPISITLTGDGTTDPLVGTTTIAVTPATDTDYDEETVVLEATVDNSATTGEASLTFTDGDISVESVVLSLNGTAGSDLDDPAAIVTFADDAGASSVAIAVTVTFEAPGLATGETRTVMVGVKDDGTTAEAGDYSTIPSLPQTLTLTGTDPPTATLSGSVNIALTPVEDTDDQDNELIVFEATIEDSDETDEAILSLTDSDNSATSVVLSLNGTAGSDLDDPAAIVTFADNIGATIVTVQVVVDFEDALANNETRTVMVGVTDDSDAEAGDYTTTPPLPVSVTLTGDGATDPITVSTNIVLTPAIDTDTDAENVVLEASIGDQTDEAILEISDVGTPVAPPPPTTEGAVISVEFDPPMLDLTEGMAFTGMVKVKVTTGPGKAATHEVVLSSDTPLPLGTATSPVSVMVAENATEGEADVAISYTPPEDDNSAE